MSSAQADGHEWTPIGVVLLYSFIATPLVVLSSWVLQHVAFVIFASGRMSTAENIALSTIPSVIGGAVVVGGVSMSAQIRGVSGTELGYFRRCWPLGAALAALGLLITFGSRSPDFGFYGQLFWWPLFGFCGGLAIEPVAASAGRAARAHSTSTRG